MFGWTCEGFAQRWVRDHRTYRVRGADVSERPKELQVRARSQKGLNLKTNRDFL